MCTTTDLKILIYVVCLMEILDIRVEVTRESAQNFNGVVRGYCTKGSPTRNGPHFAQLTQTVSPFCTHK
jgi:hypothetical protein